MEKFKDITIDGQAFRIGRLTPTTGNFIAQSFQAARTNEALFRSCQAHCFDVCSYLKDVPNEASVPMKLFERPEKWNIPIDFDTANQLYDAVVEFNFDKFFERFFAKLAKAENEAKLAAGNQVS